MDLDTLALIGNCQIAAHVRNDGAIVWACLPRFDAPPVFGALLDEAEGGAFTIRPERGGAGALRYLPNSNVLETTFESEDGAFRVVDFAPRFVEHGRSFRPRKLVRIVEPIVGTPRISVSCSPVLGWSKVPPHREFGSHHISYKGFGEEVRLTTNAPLAYIDHRPFALCGPLHFVFSWGAPVEEPLEPLCERFRRETHAYWQTWVKHCNIPALYQDEVIRSALALKLHCYEDTGAIVAALTTSLPESPGSGRTWDYRYCWLRDAYYALGAFRRLGHFEEREQFLHFLLNVASASPDLDLAPLYRIDGATDLEERIETAWPGHLGHGPVRVGNGAALHRQHDVYGEMVLALSPLFLDARFWDQVTPAVLELATRLARKAVEVAGQPDTGIWEIRTSARPQTFSTLMCWAAADRMARIAARHALPVVEEFTAAAARLRDVLERVAVDPVRGCLVADHGGTEVDAALLQAVTLGLMPPGDPRMAATVAAVRRDLERDGWLLRYTVDDGLGHPTTAFMLCTFWLVEAQARLGRLDEARALLHRLQNVRAPVGLLAEDLDPSTGQMWGNFPQAYSHVGLIHAAFAAAPPWHEAGL
jgi:GH15 family glucan-1,4-alpha-glucosidase